MPLDLWQISGEVRLNSSFKDNFATLASVSHGWKAGWEFIVLNTALEALEQHQLTAAPRADRRTLIRRTTFDLLGLPPSAADVERFVNSRRPDEEAMSRLLDRLLASPHYGERWGRQWLDVVRYADTTANDGNFIMRYVPYVSFKTHPLASINHVEEVIKSMAA